MARIALVDDDADFGFLISHILARSGLEIEHFIEPQLLLDEAKDFLEYDLYLVDLCMMDLAGVHWSFAGVSVAAHIRSRCASAKIVIITGNSSAAIEPQCRENGADMVLRKGDDLFTTASAIQGVLAAAPQASA